jgi:predicted Zn-dependent protease
MEISSLYPQQTVTLESGVEDRVAVSRQAAQAALNQENENASEEDRVELVRAQNLASPPPEEVDIDQALELLQQVQQGLSAFNRQDLRELYQFDRLRDLCAQVQMAQF